MTEAAARAFRPPRLGDTGAEKTSSRRNLAGDHGQALFEYAAVISMVSIISLSVLTAIGGIVNVDLTQIANAL